MAIHWDVKITTDRLAESYHALSIVISSASGYADANLLAVQKLQQATGKDQKEGTFAVLEIWNIKRCSSHIGFLYNCKLQRCQAMGRTNF